MDAKDDAALVAEALAGGMEAFGPIIERYKDAVFGVALSRPRPAAQQGWPFPVREGRQPLAGPPLYPKQKPRAMHGAFVVRVKGWRSDYFRMPLCVVTVTPGTPDMLPPFPFPFPFPFRPFIFATTVEDARRSGDPRLGLSVRARTLNTFRAALLARTSSDMAPRGAPDPDHCRFRLEGPGSCIVSPFAAAPHPPRNGLADPRPDRTSPRPVRITPPRKNRFRAVPIRAA